MKTATAASVLSPDYPRTVFHQNGVTTDTVQNEEEFNQRMASGWLELPGEPPPPAPEPLSPEEQSAVMTSELEGLGDQVDSQATVIAELDAKCKKLEDLTKQLVKAVTVLEARVGAIENRKQAAPKVQTTQPTA